MSYCQCRQPCHKCSASLSEVDIHVVLCQIDGGPLRLCYCRLQMGAGEEGGRRSIAGSVAARTARRSAWAATDVFSDDDDGAADGDARTRGARTGRATTAAPSQRGDGRGRRGGERGPAAVADGGARLAGGRGGNDPLDLLDAGTLGIRPIHRLLHICAAVLFRAHI